MDYWFRRVQDVIFVGVRNRSRRDHGCDNVSLQSGYDCTFVETPPDRSQTKCPICNYVLREPTQLQCCGGVYCAGCVRKELTSRQACPKCRQSNPVSHPDTRIKQSLLGLRVYCIHRAREEGGGREGEGEGERGGCEWVGKLGELDKHLNENPSRGTRMNGCLFIEIKCIFCANSFKRSSVEDHQSTKCSKRPYPCPHCQYSSTYIEITDHHLQACPSAPTDCQHCKRTFKRSKIDDHIKNDCVSALINCDFHLVGCQKRLPRPEMKAHVDDSRAQHAKLLVEHAKAHPSNRLKPYLPMLKSTLTDLAEENDSLKKWKNLLSTVVAVLILLILMYIFS